MTFGICEHYLLSFSLVPLSLSQIITRRVAGVSELLVGGVLLPATLLSHNRLICFICDPQGRAARGEREGRAGGSEVTLIAIMTNDA